MGGLDFLVLVNSCLGFGTFMLVHILIFQIGNSKNASEVFVSSFLVGGLWVIAFFIWWLTQASPDHGFEWADAIWIHLLPAGLLYLLLVFHYFAWIFGMGEAAIRVRLMIELKNMPHQSAYLDELLERYNADWILNTRLKRLVNAGHLEFDGQFYRVKGQVLLLQTKMARIFKTMLGIPR